jgi:cell division transport system permease protein
MAVASISTVALSMAVLGAFMLLALGSHRFVERQLAGFQIKVFTPTGATQAQATKLQDAIKNLPLTKRAELLSRESEWKQFKRNVNTDFDLGGVVGNILPFAIDVESKDSRQTDVLASQIRKLQGVAKVNNASEEYGRVKAVADLVRVLGFTVAIILCFTTVIIISNAIRLTVFARRHEIKIMQLVGATNWFIRIPLVLEGIVLGAIGAGEHDDLHETEIFYNLLPGARGKGYTTEAAKAVTGWALASYPIPYLIGTVEVGNLASQKVLEKCGYQLIDERTLLVHISNEIHHYRYYRCHR